MRISEIFSVDAVKSDLVAHTKQDAIEGVAKVIIAAHPDKNLNLDQIVQSIQKREALGSTGVGEGVAIPHAKIAGLDALIGCFVRCPAGVPFDAIDGTLVYLLFLVLVPEHSGGLHLRALARISRLLRDEAFRDRLKRLPDQPDLLFAEFEAQDKLYPT